MHDLPKIPWSRAALLIAVVVELVILPLYVSSYTISLLIVLLANVALATAWAFFSGATRYISLATAAFVGLGMYVVAILHEHVPIGMALAGAAVDRLRSSPWWSGCPACACAASTSSSSRSV